MVLRIGASEVGPSVSQLVKDTRLMMSPSTASRLKERRANRLKDYITMAGPLGVSHLLLFSRSASGNTNLRLALTPRGPTLHFRVERYSLCKDIKKALRHSKGGGKQYLAAPLLVMNNFTTPAPPPTINSDSNKATEAAPVVPKHLEALVTSIFQSLFPPISPQTTPLSSIRRVMLLNREVSTGTSPESDGAYVLNLRHFAISTTPTALSRPIRRLHRASLVNPSHSRPAPSSTNNLPQKRRRDPLPNLSHLTDISEYLLPTTSSGDPESGYTTANSDTEPDTDAEVDVVSAPAKKIITANGNLRRAAVATDAPPRTEKRAIKLSEIGPRMRLRLLKIEEGVCQGRVMWHESIRKTRDEEQRMEGLWDDRRRTKEERREKQRRDVERKKGLPATTDDTPMSDDEHDYDSEAFEDVDDGEIDDDEKDEITPADRARGAVRLGKVAIG